VNDNNCKYYISIQDAAELIGCSSRHLSRLAKNGIIKIEGSHQNCKVCWSDLSTIVDMLDPFYRIVGREILELEKPPQQLLFYEKSNIIKEKTSYFENKLEVGDCREWMKKMPKIVQTVITSPPYWGVRRYEGDQDVLWLDGTKVAFGLEKNPEDYVRHTLEILRQLKKVLRNDGIIWWNIGDTYFTRAYIRESSLERLDAFEGRREDKWVDYPFKRYSSKHSYLRDKDLTLVPFQVAIGAQHLGYWVRSIIIWSKENQMPEPVKDRPTTSHEYILMLTKSKRYFYNTEAAKEKASTEVIVREANGEFTISEFKNLRSVWSFSVDSNNIHTAAFPIILPLKCILASTKPGDLVFDPFIGSGTTAIAADRLGRKFFGCDLSEKYIIEAKNRLEKDRLEREFRKKEKEQIKISRFV